MTDVDIQAAAQTSKAWPFEVARKLIKRIAQAEQGEHVPFESG